MSEERIREGFTPEEAEAVGRLVGIDFAAVAFDLDTFRRGMEVELEHGRRHPDTNVTDDDPLVTGKIALAHLRETPNYYELLEAIEERVVPRQ
jgi:hypothetical protein